MGIALLGNFLGGGVLIGFYYAYVNDDAGYRLALLMRTAVDAGQAPGWVRRPGPRGR